MFGWCLGCLGGCGVALGSGDGLLDGVGVLISEGSGMVMRGISGGEANMVYVLRVTGSEFVSGILAASSGNCVVSWRSRDDSDIFLCRVFACDTTRS